MLQNVPRGTIAEGSGQSAGGGGQVNVPRGTIGLLLVAPDYIAIDLRFVQEGRQAVAVFCGVVWLAGRRRGCSRFGCTVGPAVLRSVAPRLRTWLSPMCVLLRRRSVRRFGSWF